MYKTRKKGPAGKNLWFFLLETLKSCIVNEKFNPYMTTISAFSSKIGALFPIFEKGWGRIPPPPPSSYAPSVCSILVCLSVYFSLPISTANNSFENGCPFLEFGLITHLSYFSRFITSFMSL